MSMSRQQGASFWASKVLHPKTIAKITARITVLLHCNIDQLKRSEGLTRPLWLSLDGHSFTKTKQNIFKKSDKLPSFDQCSSF